MGREIVLQNLYTVWMRLAGPPKCNLLIYFWAGPTQPEIHIAYTILLPNFNIVTQWWTNCGQRVTCRPPWSFVRSSEACSKLEKKEKLINHPVLIFYLTYVLQYTLDYPPQFRFWNLWRIIEMVDNREIFCAL